MIFVFGSNIAGRHGKGAALFALKNHGAVYGVGEGRMGNSYALPTKDKYLKPLSLEYIERFSVHNFLAYARLHPYLEFEVTKVACGLAGYKETDIAPLFKNVSTNCILPEGWRDLINAHTK